MAHVLNVTTDTFDTAVLQSKTPVLVDFWAPWCAPCRRVAPILDELAQERGGQVKVALINLDENKTLASRYQVSCIPTFFMVKDGRISERLMGSMRKSAFEALIDRNTLKNNGSNQV